jgi:hypothetical protein
MRPKPEGSETMSAFRELPSRGCVANPRRIGDGDMTAPPRVSV